jgi:hypothetical protein
VHEGCCYRPPGEKFEGSTEMKTLLALGAAFAALTMSAAAQPQHQIVIQRAGPGMNADTNGDGWISRAEASAGADAAFARLDTNEDGRLDSTDRRAFTARLAGPGCEITETGEGNARRVNIECERTAGDDGQVRVLSMLGDGENCTTEESNENGERRSVVRCVSTGSNSEDVQRVIVRPVEDGEVRVIRPSGDEDNCRREESNENGERRVTVICEGGDGERIIEATPGQSGDTIVRRFGGNEWRERVGAVPPVPPVPPVPAVPMFIMFDGEADLNGDGALSRDEFRAQQLRYFDASDANGDGRIQAPPRPPEPPAPPRPPEPPAPPAPPEPPRRR